MGASIENQYSPLNNYSYSGKSFLVSSLDCISAPCRWVFGGRNVDVLSQRQTGQTSIVVRVIIVAIAIWIAPRLAKVSLVCLAIKLATFPWVWEKNKIIVQSQQAKTRLEKIDDAARQFNSAFVENEYRKASEILRKNPEIAKKYNIQKELFKIVNQQINDDVSWDEIQTLLPLLNLNDAIELINHTIRVRLSSEFFYHLTSRDVIRFIENVLIGQNFEGFEACYKRLCSDVLQVDVSEDPVRNTVKMDIADRMIEHFITTKISRDRPGDAQCAKIQLRQSLFKTGQNYIYYSIVLHSDELMRQVRATIANISGVNEIGGRCLDDLHQLSNQSDWRGICSEFRDFNIKFGELSRFANEEEKQYIQARKKWFEHILEFFNSLSSASSVREIENLEKSFSRQSEDILAEQTKSLANFLGNKQPSYAGKEEIPLILCMNKKMLLMTHVEKMKTLLTTQLTLIVAKKLKKLS